MSHRESLSQPVPHPRARNIGDPVAFRWTLEQHREGGSPPRCWFLVDRAYGPAEGRG